MEVIKKQSVEMENDTGVQPSLNDQEVKDYLKEVIREIKDKKFLTFSLNYI
jgi:hypothetical protein